MNEIESCQSQGDRGALGDWSPQFLGNQLTPPQAREADYTHRIDMCPPDFQTFHGPEITLLPNDLIQQGN
jgi:hypothetical protein